MSVLQIAGGLEIINEAIYEGNRLLSCKDCADKAGVVYFS